MILDENKKQSSSMSCLLRRGGGGPVLQSDRDPQRRDENSPCSTGTSDYGLHNGLVKGILFLPGQLKPAETEPPGLFGKENLPLLWVKDSLG